MNVVRWQHPRNLMRSPWRESENDLDRIFDWAFGEGNRAPMPMVPALDIVEENNRFVIHADLPGMTKDDIDITYKDGTLTLKGEKKESHETQSGRVYCKERFEGRFGRNIQLPEKVDVNKIEANFKDGVLELVLPFTPESQPRKIEINK